VAKRVADVVAELLAAKEARKKSGRYLSDLRSRLGRFAEAFQKDTCNVTTAEVQAWLDAQKAAPQTVANAGRVAGELGNSAAVVHKHYRELVKPADAQRWFSVRPAKVAENVVALPTAANA